MNGLATPPACWSWPAAPPARDDVLRRFWDGIGITGYSSKAISLLQETADALTGSDQEVLKAWQARRCAVCGETGRRLVLDHDHATGLVRGWLCVSCNTREGLAAGPGTVFSGYRDRPPAAILGLTIRYRDPFAGQHARPDLPREYGWDDNAAAGLA
ncbi:endonuclease domain-containing protein [Streptomyces hydrogenans]|uniref:endonuclease domain-containing protein n=1 Tax=Streptomyces hydrogenans TaxID=1873719 RepID=UPI0035D66670